MTKIKCQKWYYFDQLQYLKIEYWNLERESFRCVFKMIYLASSLNSTEGIIPKIQQKELKIDIKTEFNFQFFKYIAKLKILTVLFMPNIMEVRLRLIVVTVVVNQKLT